MKAILLSAGFGTRFRPHTNTIAKPAIPFLNLPLIAYSINYASKWSCSDIIINTHHLPESISSCVAKLSSNLNCDIHYLNETPNILDSGGGIKNAESYLNSNDNFLVFNTDIPHILPNIDFKQIEAQHIKSNSLVTFLTCNLNDLGTKIKGIWTKENSNSVMDIGLGPKENLICKHYIGIMLISKKLFKLQPTYKPHNIIYDVILPALNNGHQVSTFHINNLKWFETGNLDSYLDASFDALDQLIDNPESLFSQELKIIFKTFNLNNVATKASKYKIIYNNLLNPGLNTNHLSGSIVLGENINLTNTKSLCNSVIYSTPPQSDFSLNRRLVL